MKYLSKEYIVRMHKSGLDAGLKADPRAERLDEALYQEVHEGKREAFVQTIRRVYAVPKEESMQRIVQSKRHAVEIGLIDEMEAEADIALAKARLEQRPPFDEAVLRNNFDKGRRREEAGFRRSLPEGILNRVADPRMLALGIAAPDVLRDIAAWCEANRRYAEETGRASRQLSEAAEATLPFRTARLLRLHDAQVERAEREGDQLALHIGAGDNHYCVLAVRFTGCEILKWEDPSGMEWYSHEIERLPDGRYSVGILFQDGPGDNLAELELTARSIEIDSPTTEEDVRAEDEKFRRLLASGVLKRVSDLKPGGADNAG